MPASALDGGPNFSGSRLDVAIANIAQLDSKARARLIPLGQPWRYPDLQRPIMSLVIVKTDAATGKH